MKAHIGITNKWGRTIEDILETSVQYPIREYVYAIDITQNIESDIIEDLCISLIDFPPWLDIQKPKISNETLDDYNEILLDWILQTSIPVIKKKLHNHLVILEADDTPKELSMMIPRMFNDQKLYKETVYVELLK
jgi:hypothetical protein